MTDRSAAEPGSRSHDPGGAQGINDHHLANMNEGDVVEAAAGAREGRALAGGGTSIAVAAQDVVDTEDSADIVSAANESPAAISVLVFGDGPEPREGRIGELADIVSHDSKFVWVDLSDYEPDDLRVIADLLGLNRVAVHVALSPWQRPRLDSFKDHYFVAATVARIDNATFRIQAGQLDLFVGNNFLVSTHKLPLPFTENIVARSRHNPELLDLDSSYMLYIVLDELLAYYEELSEQVRGDVEEAEEQALSDPRDTFLQDVLRLKRYVFALDQLIEQHRQVFEAFLRPDFSFISGQEVDVYFRDLDNRLKRLLDTLRSTRESVNGAFDIYVSHISHRTNNIIRVLTIVSTVIFPMTLVVSFFGTSFKNLPIYNTSGFVAMIVILIVMVVGILAVLKQQRWI
jgi:magnesium transporter